MGDICLVLGFLIVAGFCYYIMDRIDRFFHDHQEDDS